MKPTNKLQLIITIGILIALAFIGYQLFLSNQAPKTMMDCLKLGSDARATACMQLLTAPDVPVPKKNFPLENLGLENMKFGEKRYDNVTGTIANNFSLPVESIYLKIDFYNGNAESSFHYEVFSPFGTEQIQPHSKKTFSHYIRSGAIINGVKDLRYKITPYSALIANQ